jgi:hypothetical protein
LGFVVKIGSKVTEPRWLIADPDGTPSDFGPRAEAIVFPTRELAESQAKRWAPILEPAISVIIESINDATPGGPPTSSGIL